MLFGEQSLIFVDGLAALPAPTIENDHDVVSLALGVDELQKHFHAPAVLDFVNRASGCDHLEFGAAAIFRNALTTDGYVLENASDI